MRVIAGAAKGVRLAPVPAGTRPMADRVREGLFSSLGEQVRDAEVLDLFAGTGAVGIEALSRGARRVVFVDSGPAAVKTIRENLRRTKFQGAGTVRRMDALAAVRQKPGQFDLAFVDPPYRMAVAPLGAILDEIAGQGIVSTGGLVVLSRETRSHMPVIPLHWRSERRLTYGDAIILVFQVQR
jgi:16S rRNA (guanine966-N2)-methyltransferase